MIISETFAYTFKNSLTVLKVFYKCQHFKKWLPTYWECLFYKTRHYSVHLLSAPCNYCASMFLISSSNFTHLFSSIIFPSTHPRKGVTSCSSSAPETTSWLNKAMQRRKFSYTSWLLNRRRTWMMWGLTGKADQLHYQKKTVAVAQKNSINQGRR